MSLHIRVVDSGFPGVAPWWDRLLEASGRPSPFASHAWLSTWWETYGAGAELRILALHQGEEPVGGVALYVRRRRLRGLVPVRELRLVGDRFVGSEGLDFVVKRGLEVKAAGLLNRHLGEAFRGWDIARLDGLRPNAVLLHGEATPGAGRRLVHQSNRCPFLLLPGGRPVAPLRKDFAARVARKTRQLLIGRGVRFARCTTGAEVERALAVLFEVHQQRWQARGEPGAFAEPRKRDFYSRVAPRLLATGRLELFALWEADRARAVLFGARGGDTLYYLQSGFDGELAPFGPGNVLLLQILRDAQARGFARFDFMKGDEAYKFQWTGDEEPLLSLRAPGPRWRGRLAFALLDLERRMIGFGSRRPAAARPIVETP
jgi:CelD/BcsL family acetyltransferase involved in cellulose biosynthesis